MNLVRRAALQALVGLGLVPGASKAGVQSASRLDVNESGIVGRFYAPPGGKPRPAILMLNGSDGGFPAEKDALDLANSGWPTLALAYFQDFAGAPPGLPRSLVEIPLEYFDRALAWMKQQRQVRDRPIVIMGQSRGAELALLIGSRRADVAGVIAYSPSGWVWNGLPPYGSAPAAPRASWTFEGRPIPFRTAAFDAKAPMAEWFRNAPVDEAARIKVEDIAGPVLLISSTADTIWPSAMYADEIEARLRRMRPKLKVTNLKFDDASHLLMGSGPGIVKFKPPGASFEFDFGGSPAGTETARNEGWRQVKRFMSGFG